MMTNALRAEQAPVATTITAAEFTKLVETRRLQVERYRTAFFKRTGKLPTDTDTEIDPSWLRIQAEDTDGVTRDCILPIKIMGEWANTFDAAAPLLWQFGRTRNMGLPANLPSQQAEKGKLTISRGTSRLTILITDVEKNEKGEGYVYGGSRRWYQSTPLCNPPVPVTIGPDGAVSVTLPDFSAELTKLKAETTTNRKAVAKERAILRALKAEKVAKDAFDRATQAAAEAQAVIDGMTLPEALTFARRCLALRRTIRRDVADLERQPIWLTGTYQDDGYHPVPGSDHCERSVITVDSVKGWEEHVDTLIAARVAREGYKPRHSWPRWVEFDANRDGLSVAAYKKAHPEAAFKVYGPAFDKLKQAEDSAARCVRSFIETRFGEHCDAAGLPGNAIATTANEYAYLEQCRRYSRARLLLRTWPQRQADLESAHREAVVVREAAEAK